MLIYKINVKEKIIQKDMYYKNNIIMSYTIKYPHFISDKFQPLLNKLNNYYKTKALMYEKSNVMNMYQMAMVEYEYSIANDYPIRQFEANVNFAVTYNQNCALSLYFDQYEYAGGAHGLTIRSSDTWDLLKSKRMDLSELFPSKNNYREYVLSSVIQMISNETYNGGGQYFDNYNQLVVEHFKGNNFYLTVEGVIIYFQQYDIAPYASGISTILLPYSAGGATPPKC